MRLLQATQIIARLDRIFSRFQLQLDLLEPLLEGYIEAIDLQWLDCGKATSAQWRFLPTISLAVASVPKSSAHTPAASELSSADQMFPLNFSPRLVYRHSVDSRFDFKQVFKFKKKTHAFWNQSLTSHPLIDLYLGFG